MKKKSVRSKFLSLTILATVLGGGVFMSRANAAMNWNLAVPTDNTYKTSVALTGVNQATKNGDITLGNQINFGTYQQSLKTGTITQSRSLTNHDAIYSASDDALSTPTRWPGLWWKRTPEALPAGTPWSVPRCWMGCEMESQCHEYRYGR